MSQFSAQMIGRLRPGRFVQKSRIFTRSAHTATPLTPKPNDIKVVQFYSVLNNSEKLVFLIQIQLLIQPQLRSSPVIPPIFSQPTLVPRLSLSAVKGRTYGILRIGTFSLLRGLTLENTLTSWPASQS